MAHSQVLFALLLYTAGTLSVKTVDHVSVRKGGTITIPCLYDKQYKLNSKYWCTGYTWISCSITARANATGKWTITDYPADNIFTVKLNNPTSADSGRYWCAVEIGNNPDDKQYLYITVKEAPDVSVRSSSVSAHEGDRVSVQCFYSSGYHNKLKQWCRYKDQSCFTVGKTGGSQSSSVQINADKSRGSFTVIMTELRVSDSGWYFCSVGDLQAPVQLTVQGGNKNKTTSESDNSSGDAGHSSNGSIHGNHANSTDNNTNPEKTPEDQTWISLLWIAVPLLLLLMLVLVIWRIIQKHSLSSREPDVCSASENVAYDTVVFKKTEDQEKQVSISRPPEQDEVIYSVVKAH